MNQKIFSVFEITSQIKNLLESRFQFLEVQGEVTNLKLSSTGHIYFTLKDAKAALNCVLFKTKQQTDAPIFKNGDLLVAKGSIGLYEPSGTYQLIVRSIAKAGVGDLLAKIHALKEYFQQKGYFDAAKKKPLSKLPKKIAVVTALTGAVIQDIIKVLNRRAHSFHLLVYPVKVQGETTAIEVKEAIETINLHQLADVIIVARGGGSFEDLLPFNDEKIVEAVYQSNIPIISAIGHEVDYTLCDFVADVRAPTPSAAAEIVLTPTVELLSKIHYLSNRIHERQLHFFSKLQKSFEAQQKFLYQRGIDQAIIQHRFQLDSIQDSLENTLKHLLEKVKDRLQSTKTRIEEKNPINEQRRKKELLLKIHSYIESQVQKLLQEKRLSKFQGTLEKMELQFAFNLRKKRELLSSYEKRLSALNPKMILKKGYCIPFYQNTQSIIHSSSNAPEEMPFDILFHDGKRQVIIHTHEGSSI